MLALTIPLGDVSGGHDDTSGSPLYRLENALGAGVAFIVVPIFGFANAGVSLEGVTFDMLLAPLSLGIMLGLFVGKQLGIMMFVVAAHRTGMVQLPAEASWRQIYGVAILCGIGFTMSLFIGLLAFTDPAQIAETKLAVLCGSILSALVGAVVLLWPKRGHDVTTN
jgi:NhaA family Na+:H+ antiporter